MKHDKQTKFEDRLDTANEAKKAMLARFKPKPTVTADTTVDRGAEREAELARVRAERIAQKEAAKKAKAEAEAAARRAAQEAQQQMLEMKRGAIKERKAMAKNEARDRKMARLAMYSSKPTEY